MAVPERTRLRRRRRKRSSKQLRACEHTLLTVYRSARHIYAQLSNPLTGKTITGASTRSQGVCDGLVSSQGVEAAKRVGAAIAARANERGIRVVTFNRNGFVYAGRVKALADAAREAGLQF